MLEYILTNIFEGGAGCFLTAKNMLRKLKKIIKRT
jgi:hypothetical protein